MAKKLLIDNDELFEEVDISITDHKQNMFDKVKNSGAPIPKTVPQIFQDDKYIGGYTELKDYMDS